MSKFLKICRNTVILMWAGGGAVVRRIVPVWDIYTNAVA